MAEIEPRSISEFVDGALEVSYLRTAVPMLEQIIAITHGLNSRVQRSLSELDKEAKRLLKTGDSISSENEALRNALDAHSRSLDASQELVQANDNAIEESGQENAVLSVTAKVFLGLTASLINSGQDPMTPASLQIYLQQAVEAGIKWNIPSALDFATKYVDSPAWASRLDGWGSGYSNLTRTAILDGIKRGWSPVKTAREMRRYAENIPTHAAENLTRTLQLTAYRDAQLAMELFNGQFIEEKLRMASLDTNTCICCIALHGTPLAPGQRVDDHYRGRCDVYYVVPGGSRNPPYMQADSIPGQRNFVPWQTGEDWFASLSRSRQEQQASFIQTPAKLNAYRSGVPLSTFIGDTVDDVFGRQVIERSLIRALGVDAAQYYVRNFMR